MKPSSVADSICNSKIPSLWEVDHSKIAQVKLAAQERQVVFYRKNILIKTYFQCGLSPLSRNRHRSFMTNGVAGTLPVVCIAGWRMGAGWVSNTQKGSSTNFHLKKSGTFPSFFFSPVRVLCSSKSWHNVTCSFLSSCLNALKTSISS